MNRLIVLEATVELRCQFSTTLRAFSQGQHSFFISAVEMFLLAFCSFEEGSSSATACFCSLCRFWSSSVVSSLCWSRACAEALDGSCSEIFGREASQNFCNKVLCETSCSCRGVFVRRGSTLFFPHFLANLLLFILK